MLCKSCTVIFDECCEEVDDILYETLLQTVFFSCDILELGVCVLIELRKYRLQFSIKASYA